MIGVLLCAPLVSSAYLNPENCWSVITTLTPIKSPSELTINSNVPVAGAVAISKWHNKTPHYSLVIGTYESGEAMVLECGEGLGDNPVKGKGGCGFRLLGSSPNETIEGFHEIK